MTSCVVACRPCGQSLLHLHLLAISAKRVAPRNRGTLPAHAPLVFTRHTHNVATRARVWRGWDKVNPRQLTALLRV